VYTVALVKGEYKGRAVSFHKGKEFVNIIGEKSLSNCDRSIRELQKINYSRLKLLTVDC
jgi:hypothetical protein